MPSRVILVLAFFLMPALAHAQLIIAHRGASHDAPENTLAAFRLAWEQGADGIETDLHLTKDGKIICIHDGDTKRIAGIEKRVVETPFDELRRLDVGSWKDKRFAGERLPTLEEVLAQVPEGKRFFIEIKCGVEILPHLKRELAATKVRPEQLVIISFNAPVIAAVKKELPGLKAHWLTGYKQDKETKTWSPTHESMLATLKKIGADGLDTNAHETITEAFVKSLREAKYEFHCWTVDDPAVAKRFIKMGVDSITTNRPAWLRERLKPE
jgi:glycerophosphoryl diester phosphodiesterase